MSGLWDHLPVACLQTTAAGIDAVAQAACEHRNWFEVRDPADPLAIKRKCRDCGLVVDSAEYWGRRMA